jgi:hypothetical protein
MASAPKNADEARQYLAAEKDRLLQDEMVSEDERFRAAVIRILIDLNQRVAALEGN